MRCSRPWTAEQPSHALVGRVPEHVIVVRALAALDSIQRIALAGPRRGGALTELPRFARPPDAALLPWLEGAVAQHGTSSPRRTRVGRRRVLFVLRPGQGLQPSTLLQADIATTTEEAYDALAREHDLVVVERAFRRSSQIISLAVEQGRCVYLLTRDALDDEALRLGVLGSIAPDALDELASVTIVTPAVRPSVSAALRERVLELLEEPLPLARKVERFEQLLLSDAQEQFGSDRRAAAALGIPRSTLRRWIRGRASEK
jgi:hypothetical protein